MKSLTASFNQRLLSRLSNQRFQALTCKSLWVNGSRLRFRELHKKRLEIPWLNLSKWVPPQLWYLIWMILRFTMIINAVAVMRIQLRVLDSLALSARKSSICARSARVWLIMIQVILCLRWNNQFSVKNLLDYLLHLNKSKSNLNLQNRNKIATRYYGKISMISLLLKLVPRLQRCGVSRIPVGSTGNLTKLLSNLLISLLSLLVSNLFELLANLSLIKLWIWSSILNLPRIQLTACTHLSSRLTTL